MTQRTTRPIHIHAQLLPGPRAARPPMRLRHKQARLLTCVPTPWEANCAAQNAFDTYTRAHNGTAGNTTVRPRTKMPKNVLTSERLQAECDGPIRPRRRANRGRNALTG